MFICVKCRREMICDKNGVGANYGEGHVYASDRFKCPECGQMILATNTMANYDPNYKQQEEYLDMKVNRADPICVKSLEFYKQDLCKDSAHSEEFPEKENKKEGVSDENLIGKG